MDGISVFSEELESDSGDSSDSDSADDDYVQEASTSKGTRRGENGKNSSNAKEKEKGSSACRKQEKSAGAARAKKANSSKASSNNNNNAANPQKARGRGKGKLKALTKKELDDLCSKLEGKRPMCWTFVSERFANQHVTKHYETHRKLIREILDGRYNELRDLVNHMFSFYIKLVSEIAKDIKKDRKAHLTLRWVNSLNSYLDRSSANSTVCSAVFSELEIEYSSSTIRAVTGLLHSLVYDFAQTESYNFAQPPEIQQDVTPEDDVTLFRMSGAALCQMIKLRKDTVCQKRKESENQLMSAGNKWNSNLTFLLSSKKLRKPNFQRLLKFSTRAIIDL